MSKSKIGLCFQRDVGWRQISEYQGRAKESVWAPEELQDLASALATQHMARWAVSQQCHSLRRLSRNAALRMQYLHTPPDVLHY